MWFRINGRSVDPDRHSLQDSRLLPIDDENALVSCFAHTTGDSSNQRIVEINYIPSSTAKFQLYHQIREFRCTSHALTSKTLNFTVDAELALSSYLSAPSVFPSEFRWVGDNKDAHVSISYPGEQCDMHCVFQYQWHGTTVYFMALGLLTESERRIPWVDVFSSTDALQFPMYGSLISLQAQDMNAERMAQQRLHSISGRH
ncbi:hypothetical protein K435DRAFT_871352 [Dendrothele bispora CBS 962.96]|uniref:Uncharacterized protein n=1 Tax=Dendrothele bispora (strain CBS 962.96) TaxID=1314807 RepID=A0A4S8L4C9_DENBC|nr:hypothetical protein K435DRAFT_871352 [Dendrothele bispora CBS 962.96]